MQPEIRTSDGFGFAPLAGQVSESVPSQRPSVLLFDLCGVLFDDTVWTRWVFQLVARVGRRLSFDQFVRDWEHRHLPAVNSGRQDYWEAVKQYLLSLDLARGTVDEICVAAKARRRQFDESIRPLPGTKAGLRMLCGFGHRMAAIGNMPHCTTRVRETLVDLGLSEMFTAVFSSWDIGQIDNRDNRYQFICEQLQVAPHAIWFISASPVELQDAMSQGLAVIAWQPPRPVKSIYSIDHFQELLRMIGSGQSLAG